VVRCGVVWCGVVWCGVVWCGVVWCGVVWCGVVWQVCRQTPAVHQPHTARPRTEHTSATSHQKRTRGEGRPAQQPAAEVGGVDVHGRLPTLAQAALGLVLGAITGVHVKPGAVHGARDALCDARNE
jgi:hypothetical protein